jgi:hypothetical protein
MLLQLRSSLVSDTSDAMVSVTSDPEMHKRMHMNKYSIIFSFVN